MRDAPFSALREICDESGRGLPGIWLILNDRPFADCECLASWRTKEHLNRSADHEGLHAM